MHVSSSPVVSRLGLVALIVGIVAVALAYASAFAPAPWDQRGVLLMAFAQPLVLVGVTAMATGAGLARDWRWQWTLVLTWLVGAVGLVGALLMPTEVVGEVLWLGLPRRFALLFGLVGVVPMVVLPLMYAITFEPPQDPETLVSSRDSVGAAS